MNFARISSVWFALIVSFFALYSPALGVTATERSDAGAPRILIIAKSSKDIRLGEARFESLPEFGRALKVRAVANPKIAVLINVVGEKMFGLTIAILDECRKAGVTDVKIEGAPESTPKK